MKRKILQYIADTGIEILEMTLGTKEFDFFYHKLIWFNAYCQVMLGIELE